jgi:hypothetical protein
LQFESSTRCRTPEAVSAEADCTTAATKHTAQAAIALIRLLMIFSLRFSFA